MEEQRGSSQPLARREETAQRLSALADEAGRARGAACCSCWWFQTSGRTSTCMQLFVKGAEEEGLIRRNGKSAAERSVHSVTHGTVGPASVGTCCVRSRRPTCRPRGAGQAPASWRRHQNTSHKQQRDLPHFLHLFAPAAEMRFSFIALFSASASAHVFFPPVRGVKRNETVTAPWLLVLLLLLPPYYLQTC